MRSSPSPRHQVAAVTIIIIIIRHRTVDVNPKFFDTILINKAASN